MEKKCTKCGEVKSLDEFGNSKCRKDGKQYKCKVCCKEYQINNKEKISQYRKDYRKENKDSIKSSKQLYYSNNKEKIKEYSKEYYKFNQEKIDKKKKEWRDKNRRKINKYKNLRKEKDPLFKLSGNIRRLLLQSLKNQGYKKNTKTYNILKCEFDFFMEFLNGIASNGYQYGFGNLNLDHVIPISLAETEDEAYLLNHYSNFQLLTADENLTKGNQYVNPTNLKRVLEHHPNPDKIREIHARL